MPTAFAALESFWAASSSGSGISRPGDRNPAEVGEVLLFAAESRTNYNEPDAGKELMARAADLAPRPAWLRSAARQALIRADLVEARQYWEELLQSEPLAADAHRNLSRAIADLDGRAAAIDWVRGGARFPYHYPLHQLLIDWLRGEAAEPGERSPAEPAIRHLIDLCPDDAWAHRELALHLANHGRAAEAFADLKLPAGWNRTARPTTSRSATRSTATTGPARPARPTRRPSAGRSITKSPSSSCSTWPAGTTRSKTSSTS